MIQGNEFIKMERYINQTYDYKIVMLDNYNDDETYPIEITIYNKITGREFEYCLSFDLKESQVVAVCCVNQSDLSKEELDLAYTMIDLLNQEIVQTTNFMYSLM